MTVDVVTARTPGRAPKLNPARARAFCDAVGVGLPQYVAASRAGLGRRTCEMYVRKGRDAEAELDRLLDRLDPDTWEAFEALDDSTPSDPSWPDRGWPALSQRDEAALALLAPREVLYVRFLREVEKAWANFEARNVALVQEAARGYDVEETVEEYEQPDGGGQPVLVKRTIRKRRERSWQAAMTLLERRIPDRWSQTRRHQVTGAAGGPLEVDAPAGARMPDDLEPAARDANTAEVLSVLAAALDPDTAAQVVHGEPIEDAELVDDGGGEEEGDA